MATERSGGRAVPWPQRGLPPPKEAQQHLPRAALGAASPPPTAPQMSGRDARRSGRDARRSQGSRQGRLSPPLPSYGALLFMCSSATVGECLERGLVGAPKGDARLAEAVMRCREGDRVFMLNFSTKTLIGPFVCEARRGWVGGRLLYPDAWRNTSRGGAGAGVVCRFPWQIHVRPAAGAPARLPEADAACHLRRRGHTWDAFISEAGSNALWELMAGQVTSEPTPVQSSVVAPIAVLDAAAATPTPTPAPTPTSRPTLVTPAKSIAQQSGKRQGSTQQASAGEGQPDRKKPRQSPAPKTERRQAPAKAPPADSQPQELFGAQMQPKDLTYDPPEFIAIGDDMFE